MKRVHVQVSVEDLDNSIRFYPQLCASGPAVHGDDYARSRSAPSSPKSASDCGRPRDR